MSMTRVAVPALAVILSLALLPAAAPARASEPVVVEGQTFAAQARLAETDLQLNGAGLRAVAWFKGYAAGLYLPQRADSAAAAVAQDGPKRVQLRLLQDVPAAEFVKALDRGLQRNSSPGQWAAVQPQAAELGARVAALGSVKKGDVIDLDWDPARGLLFRVNGTLRGLPIEARHLYPALLRAFLGDKPYDKALKAALLGQPAPAPR